MEILFQYASIDDAIKIHLNYTSRVGTKISETPRNLKIILYYSD